MEKLKRYDVEIHIVVGSVSEIEHPDGRYYLAADVDAQEEARKFTRAQLRRQFEKLFSDVPMTRDWRGNYILDATRTAWEFYLFCARNNNLLKDGE